MPRVTLTPEERSRRNVERAKRWQMANPDKVREIKKRYKKTANGKASVQKYNAKYRASGRAAEAFERWRQVNKHYFAARRSCLRALEQELSEFDAFVLTEAHLLAGKRKSLSGIQWHVDHIIPVSKGGKSNASNLQVVPAAWNRRKSNRHTQRYFSA